MKVYMKKSNIKSLLNIGRGRDRFGWVEKNYVKNNRGLIKDLKLDQIWFH